MYTSQSNFVHDARTLLRAAQENAGTGGCLLDWELVVGEKSDDTAAYLESRLIRHHSTLDHKTEFQHFHHSIDEEISLVDDTIYLDEDSAPIDDLGHECTWVFSIVYSETWQSPVLYFRVQNKDGSLISSREDIVQLLKPIHHQNQVQDSWDFVSYDEHPVDGMPSFFLHPCQTNNRMTQLVRCIAGDILPSGLLLLIWMSLIFPAVGLVIPSRVFDAIMERLSDKTKSVVDSLHAPLIEKSFRS